MLHLESGACDCQVDQDGIKQLALECRQSRHFRNDKNYDFPFKCPSCGFPTSKLGALLQHVMSDKCEEKMSFHDPLPTLLRFLKKRIKRRY